MRNSINHPNCFNNVTGKTDILESYDSINKSLDLLLCTSKGELLGDPDYGTDIMKYIYETNTNVLNDLLSSEIVDAVTKYEKRIIVTANDIQYQVSNSKLEIFINYTLYNSNSSNSYKLEIAKE